MQEKKLLVVCPYQTITGEWIVSSMVYQMIRIGEEAGSTEEMLDKIADYYDEEVEMEIQSLMVALEPMIIIVLAIVVGGIDCGICSTYGIYVCKRD